MAPQPHIQGEERHKGRKRRRYKQIPLKDNKAISISLDQGLVKEKVSQTDLFVTTFVVKKMPFGVQRRVPPRKLPNSNIKAVMVLTHERCSSIFYVSVSAANTWWHPDHTSKEEEKHKGRKRRRYKQMPLKDNKVISISFRSGFGQKKVSQTDPFVTTFFVKQCHLEFKEGSPPQIATFSHQGSHGFNKCMMFIHILCIGFCS